MMERQIIKLLLIGLVGITGCYYDSEERLYPTTECKTANMSFQTNIVPILEQNCYGCHSAAVNTANVSLEGYNNVLQYVNNGKLLGVIRHSAGYKPMPQNAPQLASCDIARIEQWIVDGIPNN